MGVADSQSRVSRAVKRLVASCVMLVNVTRVGLGPVSGGNCGVAAHSRFGEGSSSQRIVLSATSAVCSPGSTP